MTDFPFEGQLIADPVTFQRATNAQVYVYDANDTTNSTPLALKDSSGLPTANPLTSSADAFVRPIYAPSQDIKYVGAGLTVFVSSAKGMRDAAAASAEAAQAAADSATTAAGNTVASASVNVAGELVIQKASGATLNAGPVKGAKGDKGDTGAPGLNGSNVLPTDAAIAQALQDPNSQTLAAGNAIYVPRWKANTAYLAGDKVMTPAGQIVSATVNFTSGATYNASNWTYGSSARGKAGRSYAFVAGVLRNYDDGLGWQLVRDGFHPPIGITAVDSLSDTGLIRVDYPGLKMDGTDAGRTVTLLAQPDETLTKAGFTCGASVEPGVARIQLQQTRAVNDKVYYDATAGAYKLWKTENWGAGRSPFTVNSATNNHLILGHPQAILDDRFDFSVEPVGGPGENYRTNISTATPDTILTQVAIDFWADFYTGSKTVDFAAIGDGSSTSTTVTVTGAAMGDFANASLDVALPGGMVMTAAVTAANTVTVTLYNRSGATQDLASATLRAITRPAAGGSYRVTTPDAKCKAYVKRGMARSYVAPADVNETTYPSGNIWLIGIMQDQSLA